MKIVSTAIISITGVALAAWVLRVRDREKASRLDRRRFPAGHCQKCGYDLTGSVSGRCPECGEPT